MNFLNIVIYIILFWLLIDFILKNRKTGNSDPPTAGTALPIIGHLHKFGENPHRSLTELSKKYGGIYSIYIGDIKTVVITDPLIIKEVCVKQFTKFASRPKPRSTDVFPKFKGLAFSPYDQWQRKRKLVSSAFTKTKIKTFNDLIEKQTSNFIQSISSFSNNNDILYPKKYITKFTINIICSMLFSREIGQNESVDEGTMKRLTIPFQEAFKKVGTNNINDFIWFLRPFFYFSTKRFKNYVFEIYHFMEEIYDQHITDLDKDDPKDLMDQLIIATEGKEKESTILIGVDFLLAGSDTNGSSTEWFCLYLCNNPEIQAKAYAEIIGVVGKDCKFVTLNQRDKLPYLVAIIKEVLRIRSPGPLGIPRICSESTDVCGHYIQKDTQILLNIYGAGNTYVSNPTEFKPERWIEYKNKKNKNAIDEASNEVENNDYFDDLDKVSIAFSLGPRNCVGSNLAEATIFSVCSNILLNYEITSADNKIIDDTEVFGISIHPKNFGMKIKKRIPNI